MSFVSFLEIEIVIYSILIFFACVKFFAGLCQGNDIYFCGNETVNSYLAESFSRKTSMESASKGTRGRMMEWRNPRLRQRTFAKRKLGCDMDSHKEPMNGVADGNIGSGASSGFA